MAKFGQNAFSRWLSTSKQTEGIGWAIWSIGIRLENKPVYHKDAQNSLEHLQQDAELISIKADMKDKYGIVDSDLDIVSDIEDVNKINTLLDIINLKPGMSEEEIGEVKDILKEIREIVVRIEYNDSLRSDYEKVEIDWAEILKEKQND